MRLGARLPAGRVRIRAGEGLARGLRAALCALPGAPAGGSAFLPVQADTSLTYMARSSGYWRGHRYPFHDGTLSSGGWGTYLTGGGISSNAQALTMAGLVRNTGAVGGAGLTVSSGFGGSFPCLRFGQEFGGDSSFGVTHRSGNGSYLSVSNAGDTALKARFAVARIRADDRLDLWIDGVYIGSTPHSRGGFNTFYNAGAVLSAYYSLYASLSVGYAWDRFLSDAEVIALSEDPFRLIDTGDPLTVASAEPIATIEERVAPRIGGIVSRLRPRQTTGVPRVRGVLNTPDTICYVPSFGEISGPSRLRFEKAGTAGNVVAGPFGYAHGGARRALIPAGHRLRTARQGTFVLVFKATDFWSGPIFDCGKTYAYNYCGFSWYNGELNLLWDETRYTLTSFPVAIEGSWVSAVVTKLDDGLSRPILTRARSWGQSSLISGSTTTNASSIWPGFLPETMDYMGINGTSAAGTFTGGQTPVALFLYAPDVVLTESQAEAIRDNPLSVLAAGEPQASLSLDGAILANPQFARPIADLVNSGWIRS